MTDQAAPPNAPGTRKRRRAAERAEGRPQLPRPQSASAPTAARDARRGHARRRLTAPLSIPAHERKTIWIRTRDGKHWAQIPMGPLAHDPTIRDRVANRFMEDPRLGSGTKAFLSDLLTHSDKHNKSVYGSQQHYAERADACRKTIYNRTAAAEEAGYLKVVRCKPHRRRNDDGSYSFTRKWTNRYWLVIVVEDFKKYAPYFARFLFPRPEPAPAEVPPPADTSAEAPEQPSDGSLPERSNAPPPENPETSHEELPAVTAQQLFAHGRALRRGRP